MAITSAICNSFKVEILKAEHNFTASSGNTFNLALYTSSASLGAATTAYTTSNEASGTNYTAKGSSLTRVDPTTSSTTAFTDFADLTFPSLKDSTLKNEERAFTAFVPTPLSPTDF